MTFAVYGYATFAPVADRQSACRWHRIGHTDQKCLTERTVTKHVSAATAKAHFSELISEVGFGGQPVVIERHGRPLAALVSLDDLERINNVKIPEPPRGALALVGILGHAGIDDAVIDAMLDETYAQRDRDLPRPLNLGERCI